MIIPLALILAAASLESRIDGIVADALREGPAAGASIAVLRAGKSPIVKAYGFANLELGVKASPETLYRIGSDTKQFTAAAVLLLVERGKLRLDQDIAEIVPAYAPRGARIEVQQLLRHTSGIASTTSLGAKFWKQSAAGFSKDELIALFKDEPLHFPPGSKWEYSNSNYALLGAIVEQLSGMKLGEFIEREIATRAGTPSVVHCGNEAILKNRAAGYDTDHGKLANASHIEISSAFGAGDLCATALDLARFVEAIEAGKVGSWERMTAPGLLADGSATQYGMGLALGDLGGVPFVGHGGAINGFATDQQHFSSKKLTVVAAVNTGGDAADVITHKISRLLLGIPEPVTKDLALADGAPFAGAYQFSPTAIYEIGVDKGRLELHPRGDPTDSTALLYQGADEFVIKGSPRHLRFNRKDGSIVSMSMGDGQKWFAEARRLSGAPGSQ